MQPTHDRPQDPLEPPAGTEAYWQFQNDWGCRKFDQEIVEALMEDSEAWAVFPAHEVLGELTEWAGGYVTYHAHIPRTIHSAVLAAIIRAIPPA